MTKTKKSQRALKQVPPKKKCLPKLVQRKYKKGEANGRQCKSLCRRILQNEVDQLYHNKEKDQVIMNIKLQKGCSYPIVLIPSYELNEVYIPNQKKLYPFVKEWSTEDIVYHIIKGLNTTIKYGITKFIGHKGKKQMTTILPFTILTDSPRIVNHQIKPLGKVFLTKRMFRMIFNQQLVEKDENIKQYLLQGENKDSQKGNMKLFNFSLIKKKLNDYLDRLLIQEKIFSNNGEENVDLSLQKDKIQIESPPQIFYQLVRKTDRKLQLECYFFQEYQAQYQNLQNQELKNWFIARQNQQIGFIKDLKKKIKKENSQNSPFQEDSSNDNVDLPHQNFDNQIELDNNNVEHDDDFSLQQSVHNIMNDYLNQRQSQSQSQPQSKMQDQSQSIWKWLDL